MIIDAIFFYFVSFLNQFIFRNPILHIDAIYEKTTAGKQYAKNCDLARGKAKEIIRQRRATLQDNVSAGNLIFVILSPCSLGRCMLRWRPLDS